MIKALFQVSIRQNQNHFLQNVIVFEKLVLLALLSLVTPVFGANSVGVVDLSTLPSEPIKARLIGTMDTQAVTESSGLVTSLKHDGVLWTINDSGNSASIYPINLNGDLLNNSPSKGILLTGAENFDWEAMTSDDKGHLYIADTGQNFNLARTQIIYKIQEPTNLAQTRSVAVLKELSFNYEDQSGFLMPRNEFDVEAVFYSDHSLNLLTKGWGESISKWYRLRQSEKFVNAARLVTRVNFGKSLITGAEVDHSGLRLAVLAKRSIWLFTRDTLGQNWFSADIKRFKTRDIGVTEGITFYGNRLFISNESGQLYSIILDKIHDNLNIND